MINWKRRERSGCGLNKVDLLSRYFSVGSEINYDTQPCCPCFLRGYSKVIPLRQIDNLFFLVGFGKYRNYKIYGYRP